MSRYITRRPRPKARVWYDDGFDHSDESKGSTLTVHEPDNEPIPTGLLDAQGNELLRKPERRPVGFGHAYEVKD